MAVNMEELKRLLVARQEYIAAKEDPTDAELDEFQRWESELKQPNGLSVILPRKSGAGASSAFVAPGEKPSLPAALTKRGKSATAKFFRDEAPDRGNFSDITDFARAINFGDTARLTAATGQSVGSDPNGGFFVPTQFSYEMLDQSLESEVVRPRANVIPMTTDEISIPVFDDASHAAGTVAGLAGGFYVEGGTIDYEAAVVRRVTMKAHGMKMLCRSTNELIADAPGFEGQFTKRMSGALSWNLDRIFIAGTGVGMPLGAMNDPATISVAKESGQPNDTIVYENLSKMASRLHPNCWKNAVWVVNPSAIPQLLELTISIGTGGQVIPVMTGSMGNFSILTMPVIFSEKMSALGDLGDIMLVDWSQYLIGLRSDLRLDKSQHVRFTSDESVWRLVVRCNGFGSWKSAFTPLHGNTQSWCVTLAAR